MQNRLSSAKAEDKTRLHVRGRFTFASRSKYLNYGRARIGGGHGLMANWPSSQDPGSQRTRGSK